MPDCSQIDLNPSIIIEQEDEVTRSLWRNGNGNGKGNGKKNKQADDYDDLLPPKIEMYEDLHDEDAERIIIRLAVMLSHLRAIVPTWETYGSQGSKYAFAMPRIEDPTRAMTQMRNLAKGHALSQGRLYFTMEDIPFIIQVVMSTASTERVRIFELLLANNGILNTSQICTFLDVSKPTALRTMTELKVAGLVDIPYEDRYNAEKQIRLKANFNWFLTDEFADPSGEEGTRKEKYPPRDHDDKVQTEEQSANNSHNTEHETTQNNDVRGGGISLQSSNEGIKNSSNDGPYSCPYYDCNNNRYASEDFYLRHVVKSHKGWTAYPGPPDLEKYKQLHDSKSKVAEMAAANLSGNNIMGCNSSNETTTCPDGS